MANLFNTGGVVIQTPINSDDVLLPVSIDNNLDLEGDDIKTEGIIVTQGAIPPDHPLVGDLWIEPTG